MADSTVQVISWDMGSKQSYFMSLQKVKLKGTDTTANEFMRYVVDITSLRAESEAIQKNAIQKNAPAGFLQAEPSQ